MLTGQNGYSILLPLRLIEGRQPAMADEEVEQLQEQLTEAREEVERLQVMAADREARALQLEELQGETRGRLEAVESDLSAATRENGELHARLQVAAGKYREALLMATPELPAELVAGESIEEVEASLAQARLTVAQVRERLQSQAQSGRVPAGSPPRGGLDLSGLSALEKIRFGLQGK